LLYVYGDECPDGDNQQYSSEIRFVCATGLDAGDLVSGRLERPKL
jgi:hypothetical protein